MSHRFSVCWYAENDNGALVEFAHTRTHLSFDAARDDQAWCRTHLADVVPDDAYWPPLHDASDPRAPRDPRGPHVTDITSDSRAPAEPMRNRYTGQSA